MVICNFIGELTDNFVGKPAGLVAELACEGAKKIGENIIKNIKGDQINNSEKSNAKIENHFFCPKPKNMELRYIPFNYSKNFQRRRESDFNYKIMRNERYMKIRDNSKEFRQSLLNKKSNLKGPVAQRHIFSC